MGGRHASARQGALTQAGLSGHTPATNDGHAGTGRWSRRDGATDTATKFPKARDGRPRAPTVKC
eukprot:352473-Chlamydomonas_euryale.AAC.18